MEKIRFKGPGLKTRHNGLKDKIKDHALVKRIENTRHV
jgi:hypothetical protein